LDVYIMALTYLFTSAIIYQCLALTLQETSISLDVNKLPIYEVNERFLSVAIDSAAMKKNFKHFNFDSSRLKTLADGLNSDQLEACIYLRLGGSDADHFFFVPSEEGDNYGWTNASYSEEYTFTFATFEKLYRFATNMDWRVIFDLNSLIRNKDGTWNPTNAVEFIKQVSSRNYSIDYELGNEPDLYPKYEPISVAPEQLAEDFKTLKGILFELTGGASKLYGPDMATLGRYNFFHNFLANLQEGVLDAITFHHYYGASVNVTTQTFTSVDYLDSFLTYGFTAMNIIEQSTSFHRPPVWIGETSSTYGGGNPDIGESFAAGFLWLDKLGLAAQLNIDVVIRQALKGGSYSLLDKEYNPCPDYWTSLLYKQLIGTKVLNLTGFLKFNRTIRVYGHCVNKHNKRSYSPKDTIVFIALNMHASDNAEITLNGELGHLDADAFLFAPANGRLDSKLIQMNGKVLKMIDDYHLPTLSPILMKQPLRIPPLTYAFFVVENSNVLCE